MSDNGSSDLDVFGDAKSNDGGALPSRKKTLLGVQAPGLKAPPPPPSRSLAPPPPPPSRIPAAAPPEPLASAEAAAPAPSAPALPPPSAPALPPPSAPMPPAPALATPHSPEAPSPGAPPPAVNLPPPSAPSAPAANAPVTTALPPPSAPAAPMHVPPPSASVRIPEAAERGSALPPPAVPPHTATLPFGAPVPERKSALPPPAAPPAAPPAPAASGWDDEDEKTTVFDRASTDDVAAALLRSLPPPTMSSTAAAPPPPMSRPSAPVPSLNLPPSQIVTKVQASPASLAPAGTPKSNMGMIIGLGLAVALVGAGLAYTLNSKSAGSLAVTVSGPGNREIADVEIYVDGEKKCSQSPCSLKEIEPGVRFIQVKAKGYEDTAKVAVEIKAGADAVSNLSMIPEAQSAGLKVAGDSSMKLFIDGKEIGPLPQDISDIEAGSHKLKIVGDEHFFPYEKTITISEGKIETLEAVKLKVAKGVVSFVAGNNTKKAKFTLLVGDSRKKLSPPTTLNIDTSKRHVVLASAKGYADFEQEITFEDGVYEQKLVIDLESEEEESSSSTPSRGGHTSAPATAPAPASSPASAPSPAATAAPSSSPAASGSSALNINSIPSSTVVLDGKPLGKTPRIGITVSPGTHTVVFISDGQRESRTVTVGSGETKTVAVKF